MTYRHSYTLHAYSGHREPLAKHIEEGGELTPCMKEFLVALLRGEEKPRRGRTRTLAQRQLDAEIGEEVNLYRELFGLSLYGAREKYLAAHPRINSETLRSILKRLDEDRREVRERLKRRIESGAADLHDRG